MIGEDVTLWMRDFSIAVHVDDSAIANLDVSTLPYRITSWSFRCVFTGLGGAFDAWYAIIRLN